MEGLQGGGATSSAVAAEVHTTFLEGPCLQVEGEALWVLNAGDVSPLVQPDLLDALVVQQRHSHSVLPALAVQLVDERLDPCSSTCEATVTISWSSSSLKKSPAAAAASVK